MRAVPSPWWTSQSTMSTRAADLVDQRLRGDGDVVEHAGSRRRPSRARRGGRPRPCCRRGRAPARGGRRAGCRRRRGRRGARRRGCSAGRWRARLGRRQALGGDALDVRQRVHGGGAGGGDRGGRDGAAGGREDAAGGEGRAQVAAFREWPAVAGLQGDRVVGVEDDRQRHASGGVGRIVSSCTSTVGGCSST